MQAPRSVLLRLCALLLLVSSLGYPQTQYSHGDPTDEEQLFLEYINQARASIDDEVVRLTNTTDPDVVSSVDFFNVDLDLMASQFETLKTNNGNSQMPLAFHPNLIAASRLHSEDMFISVFQGHDSSSNALDPNSPGDTHGARISAQGYLASGSAENVFAAADSVWHGHAGFNIDWGNGPGGIQDPAGHRNSIHANGRREIGVGVYLGTRDQSERPDGTQLYGSSSFFSDVGPVLVTQVFAKQQSSTGFDVPFLTGVSFLDIDSDQFYSLGEGLQGLRIDVESATYYAETSNSGGFAIPLPNQAGTYDLTLSGPGITTQTFTDAITVNGDLDNVKWDYMPAFSLPSPSGSSTPTAGSASSYTFGTLPGAASYRVRASELDDSGWTEGAENGETGITLSTFEGYDSIQGESINSGSFAFRFAVVFGSFENQILEIDRDIIPSSTSEIQYASRRGLSTADQIGEVQISTDGGSSWETLETLNDESTNNASFAIRSINLSNYADQVVRIRFIYYFLSGQPVYTIDNEGSGWFIDDITVTNSSLISASALADITDTEFEFTPPAPGPFMLETTGINGERVFPFGVPLFVEATGSSTGGTLADSLAGFSFYNELNTEEYFSESADLSDDGHPFWRGYPDSHFGVVQIEHFPWVFHGQMGYVYLFGPGGQDIYLYIPDLDAIGYTGIGSDFFPYIYDYTHGHWWYFDIETSTPTERHFYSFKPGNEGWQTFTP